MAEINKIFDDLNNSNLGINKEHQLFKEFLEYLNTEKSDKIHFERKIIYFNSGYRSEFSDTFESNKIAAADSNYQAEINHKGGFLLSKDKSFALKYSYIKNSDLQVSLLTSENLIEHNFILFSRKLDKFFISDKFGSFSIGKYENFNLSDFDFAAIEQIDKLQVLKINEEYIVNSGIRSEYNLKITDNFITLIPEPGFRINCCVLVTNKTKDTLNIKDGSVEIPKLLLEDKSLLYLY